MMQCLALSPYSKNVQGVNLPAELFRPWRYAFLQQPKDMLITLTVKCECE